LDQNATVISVVELSHDKWLVGAIVPGITRDPLKALAPDPEALIKLLYRWRDEAAGSKIKRIVVGFEAGRDGFWLARWLRARGIEAYVIHPTSIPISRKQRRAKTDRLDIALLKRSLRGWLLGEKKHLHHGRDPRSQHWLRKTQRAHTASASNWLVSAPLSRHRQHIGAAAAQATPRSAQYGT
jgi:transposase